MWISEHNFPQKTAILLQNRTQFRGNYAKKGKPTQVNKIIYKQAAKKSFSPKMLSFGLIKILKIN